MNDMGGKEKVSRTGLKLGLRSIDWHCCTLGRKIHILVGAILINIVGSITPM